jgi:hypothetical protein
MRRWGYAFGPVVVLVCWAGCSFDEQPAHSPCDGIDCGGVGHCAMRDGRPGCVCPPGHHADGLRCRPDADPCAGVDCSGHGRCAPAGDDYYCICDEGYVRHDGGCRWFCEGVDCGEHGRCVVAHQRPRCDCDEGWVPEDMRCIPATDCTGIVCEHDGACFANNGDPFCICRPGYIAVGFDCFVDHCAVDPCPPKSECRQEGPDYRCVCDYGYHMEAGRCVPGFVDCEDVDCEGHGRCRLEDGVAICRCAPGWHRHLDSHCGQELPVGLCSAEGLCWRSHVPFGRIADIHGVAGERGAWFWTDAGLVSRSGSEWRFLPAPLSQESQIVGTVGAAQLLWVADKQDVWAFKGVSLYDSWASNGTYLLHWNGQSLEEVYVGHWPTHCGTAALWGLADESVFLFADFFLFEFDGAGWQTIRVLEQTEVKAITWYVGIWGTQPDQLLVSITWASVLGAFFHSWIWSYDGDEWKLMWRQDDIQVRGLFGFGWDDVWAWGERERGRPFVLHFDGLDWQLQPIPVDCDPGSVQSWDSLREVWGASSSELWAACTAALLRFDGAGWELVERARLNAIWGSNADDVWFGGERELYHWDGTELEGNMIQSLDCDVRRIAVVAEDDLWFFGRRCSLHYDGVSWLRLPSGQVSDELQVLGPEQVLGMDRRYLSRFDGRRWDRLFETTGEASGMWAAAADSIWVADGGDIYHWDGQSYTLAYATGAGERVAGIWGRAADDVWAYGGAETAGQVLLAHYDGSGWQRVPLEPAGRVHSLWAAAADDAWAVGATPDGAPLLLRWDGSRWTQQASPVAGELQRVWGHAGGQVRLLAQTDDINRWLLAREGGDWTIQRRDLPSKGDIASPRPGSLWIAAGSILQAQN